MCRFCWILVAVLLVATGTLVGKFIITGETQLAADGRTAIILEPVERDLILTEMRACAWRITSLYHEACSFPIL